MRTREGLQLSLDHFIKTSIKEHFPTNFKIPDTKVNRKLVYSVAKRAYHEWFRTNLSMEERDFYEIPFPHEISGEQLVNIIR